MIAALRFIIEAIANVILLFILLRFWMPVFRVDFRNPISQAILKFTGPVVVPLRRILPAIRQFDTATFVAAFAVQFLARPVKVML